MAPYDLVPDFMQNDFEFIPTYNKFLVGVSEDMPSKITQRNKAKSFIFVNVYYFRNKSFPVFKFDEKYYWIPKQEDLYIRSYYGLSR